MFLGGDQTWLNIAPSGQERKQPKVEKMYVLQSFEYLNENFLYWDLTIFGVANAPAFFAPSINMMARSVA